MNHLSKISFIAAFLFISLSSNGQSITGLWKTVDDKDGKAKSYMRVYEEDGKIHGKVEKLISQDLTICKKCKDERKGQPIEGMVIIWDMKLQADGECNGGEIIDPKSGKIYKCKLSLDGPERLDVRGYIGVPVFGRTQTWLKVEE